MIGVMYCLKCGQLLAVEERGKFVCPSGLHFSLALSRRLREFYPAAVNNPIETRAPGGMPPFCPGCGCSLGERAGRCVKCGLLLPPDIVYQMIELHPHPDGHGGF